MADILTFRKRPPGPPRDEQIAVWRCDCGCATHYARADGTIECAFCGNIASGVTGAWRQHLPSHQDAPEIEEGTHVTVDMATTSAACRRVLETDPEKLAAVVAIHRDGKVRTWGAGFEGKPRAAWLRRKLAAALKLLLPPKEGDRHDRG